MNTTTTAAPFAFDRMGLASAIHRARGERTLHWLSDETRISRSTLSRLENCQIDPDSETLSLICRYLKRAPEDFFYGASVPNPDKLPLPDRVEQILEADPRLSPDRAKALGKVFRISYAQAKGGTKR